MPCPFEIGREILTQIVPGKENLEKYGGFQEIARALGVSLESGVSTYGNRPHITERREFYGSNEKNESTVISMPSKEKLQEGKDKKKKKILEVKVVRDGRKKLVGIGELVVGDIVLLFTGDQVPADGLFVQGRGLSVLEPEPAGAPPLVICHQTPHIPKGSTVLSGSAKMLLTSVGMTEWVKMKYPLI